MAAPNAIPTENANRSIIPLNGKLWIYTNYDCNLSCTYCVAESTPLAPRRSLSLPVVRQLVDEAHILGFDHFFFTGGEPFMHDEIDAMVSYALNYGQATVLTNAMLLRGKRLQQLEAIATPDLVIQVSLDGAQAQHHDHYRGDGTWIKTVEGIRRLQERGFRLRLATTETPANTNHMEALHTFCRSLGISDEDHIVRPLARRGFSQTGINVSMNCLVPEVTVTAEGAFWHPLAVPGNPDLQVSQQIFPLVAAVDTIQRRFGVIQQSQQDAPRAVT